MLQRRTSCRPRPTCIAFLHHSRRVHRQRHDACCRGSATCGARNRDQGGPVEPGRSAQGGRLRGDRNNERVIEKPQGSRRTDEPLAGPPANEVTLQFLRACTGLIVGFQALFLVAHAWLLGPNFTRELLALHLFNVAGGCLGFLATYSRFIHRHWRRVAMAVAGAVVIGAALIAAVAHEREILTYELTLFLTGTGAFLPWEPGWQLVFNVVALAAYAPVAGMRGDPAVIVGW